MSSGQPPQDVHQMMVILSANDREAANYQDPPPPYSSLAFDVSHSQAPVAPSYAPPATGPVPASSAIPTDDEEEEEEEEDTGQGKHSLSLKGLDMSESEFVAVLAAKAGQRLEQLDLSKCNGIFMSGKLLERPQEVEAVGPALSGVRRLDLSRVRYLSDALLQRLADSLPSLQSLRLAACSLNCHFARPKGQPLSMSVLSGAGVLDMVCAHRAKLTCLDLSRTSVSDQVLTSIVSVPGLRLEELQVNKCSSLSNQGLAALVPVQAGLERLGLAENRWVDDQSVQALSTLRRLDGVDLTGCGQLTRPALAHLTSSLPALSCLGLAECQQFSSQCLPVSLCRTLTRLDLRGCPGVDDEAAAHISSLTALRWLDLSRCFGLGDRGLCDICDRLPQLVSLNLAWCTRLTHYGLLGLKHLVDGLSLGPADSSQREANQTYAMIKNKLLPPKSLPTEFSSGRYSRMHGSAGFFSKALDDPLPANFLPPEFLLQEISRHPGSGLQKLAKLRALDLSACFNVQEVGIFYSLRSPRLRRLSLAKCPNVSDRALASLAVNCPNLRHLCVEECVQVGNPGVDDLVNRLPRLESLDLSQCPSLTDAALATIQSRAKNLRFLDIANCPGLSRVQIDSLQYYRPHITIREGNNLADIKFPSNRF